MSATPVSVSPLSVQRSAWRQIATVLAAICVAWVVTRWWLYPALGVPSYAPMLLRPILGFATAWWLLARSGGGWRDVGLRAAPSWPRAVLAGAAVYAAMTLVSRYAVPPLAEALSTTSAPSLIAQTVRGSLPWLALWLMIGWGVGGVIEELLFRGFLLGRIEIALGGGRRATVAAIVAQAVVFGALHVYQGSFGAVSAGVFALVLGAGYVLAGRNLWPLILVHGIWNSVSIWGAYAG